MATLLKKNGWQLLQLSFLCVLELCSNIEGLFLYTVEGLFLFKLADYFVLQNIGQHKKILKKCKIL